MLSWNALFEPRHLLPFLRRLIRWRKWVLAGALALTVAALYPASHLPLESNLISLLPKSAPSVQALERVVAKAGGTGELLVLIESPAPEAARRYADALLPRIRQLPWVADARHGPDAEFLAKNRLLYLDLADLETIDRRVQSYLDRETLKHNPLYVDLEDEDPGADRSGGEPGGGPAAGLDLRDIEDKYRARRAKVRPYYESADGKSLLIVVLPKGSAGDLEHARRISAELEAAVAAENPARFGADLRVSIGGTVRSRIAELDGIRRDVTASAIVVAIGVALLLGLFFRSFLAIPLLFIPLAMSLAWTFALAHFVVGSLNLVTVFLVNVLMGLSADLGIHMLKRFQAERQETKPLDEILGATVAFAGRPALMAALSTGAAFAALMLVEFRGFSDFGFIAASGLVFSSVAYLIVFPILLSWVHERGWLVRRRKPVGPRRPGRPLRAPLAVAVAIAGGAATLAAFGLAPGAGVEHDIRNIRSRLPEVRAFNHKVSAIFPEARDPAVILVDDPSQVSAVVAAVEARRRAGGDASLIAEVRSVWSLLPRDVDQKLAIARGLRQRVADLRGKLDGDELARLDEVLPSLDPQPLRTPADLPASLRRPFEGMDGTPGQMVLVYQRGTLLDLRRAVAFSDALTGLEVDGRSYAAASEPLVYADLSRVLARDAPRAVALALVCLLAMLAFDLRSAADVGRVLLPLAVGAVWTLALMAVFDVKLNLLNACVLPSGLGLCIDGGVHVVHRVREVGIQRMSQVIRETGSAVGVCIGTSLIGFSGMLATAHPGLRSVSHLAMIALVTTFIAGVFVLPALMTVRFRRRARRKT